MGKLRILGIDPGLQNTGWGVLETCGSGFNFIATGIIHTTPKLPLADRLAEIHRTLLEICSEFSPDEVSIEETFMNNNPISALKLGHARGVAMLAPALLGITVFEYAPNQIKKMIVGVGHADKNQVEMMIRKILKGLNDQKIGPDAFDALAIALCHGYMRNSYVNRNVGK